MSIKKLLSECKSQVRYRVYLEKLYEILIDEDLDNVADMLVDIDSESLCAALELVIEWKLQSDKEVKD
jgi:hypothetical protein